MNIIDTIQSSKLIYSTFTKWGLKKYTCDVAYFTEEPLDDLSFVICSILKKHEGVYDKRELGIFLGFSLSDYKSEGEIIRYYDVAERNIFEELLQKVEREHLIEIYEKNIILTKLGYISVSNNIHYQFFTATQGIYEHLKLKTLSKEEMELFPFFEDLGFYTSLENSKKIWPEDNLYESIIYCENNNLIERIRLNSCQSNHIYYACKQEYFDIENKNIEVKLYQENSSYLIEVVGSNGIAVNTTTLVNQLLNVTFKENLILECLFQQLWDDKSAVLNNNSLNKFYELVDFEELTKDPRTQWQDKELLDVIFLNANQTCWKNISRFCDVDSLYPKLTDIVENINWNIFSLRVDDEFLVKEFKNYPWDLEAISQDYDRKETIIEELILIQKETTEDWNWDVLEDRLTENFILKHLDLADVNLAKHTKDTDSVRAAILKNLDKRWDWDVVESTFDLNFILNNITSFSQYLNYISLLDRVFSDEEWSIKYCKNKEFISALKYASSDKGPLASYVLNNKEYIWSDLVIKVLTEIGLLCWESTPYMLGFECNDKLVWNETFFDKYAKFVISPQGYSHVSASINDIYIIVHHPNWSWDWDAVSANTALLSNVILFNTFGYKLNWSTILDNIEDRYLLESVDNINIYLSDNQEAWNKFSTIARVPYVIKTFKDSQFLWNWSVLTERMFPNLKLGNLGNKLFVDKWDWNYLTNNVDIDFLLNNLSTYAAYWNWSIVFDRILVKNNRLDFNYLDGIVKILSSIESSIRTNAWTALTSKYSFKEQRNLILGSLRRKGYWWDMKLFCQNDEFDVFKDLEPCRNLIDWDALSSSKAVDKSLKYNEKLGIKKQAWTEDIQNLLADSRNKWNFKLLSSFESLINQYWFISRNKEKLDWQVISKESRIFTEKDKQKINETIEKFKSFIDFKILSERSDVDIQQIIKIYPRGNYDYNVLLRNNKIEASVELVNAIKNYEWDWFELTSKEHFKPTADMLLAQFNKNINWEYLSQQDNQALWSDIKLLKRLANREDLALKIDWYTMTSRNYFPIDMNIIDALPLSKLNWKALSGRKAILLYLDRYDKFINWHSVSNNKAINYKDFDFLKKYKDKLDWSVICANPSFHIDNMILEIFSNYIDWNEASASLSINFTKTLVEKFKDKWNWPILVKNKAFHNRINIAELSYARQLNIVDFIKQFPCTPKAYHFTHLSNAVNIIRSMKLQSRNLADGSFSNSAGTNVSRTAKAHRFARFYFAPQSPTQFYNECLGKDSDDDKYYTKALRLGLPKCPMPVFLIFDIEELLTVMPEKCYYSNGNMQKDSSRSFKVIEDPNKIKAKEIYINSRDTFDERQQEFLIDGELDFSHLSKVQICCYDEFQAELLRKEITGTKWEDMITVNKRLYMYDNKELKFADYADKIIITSDYSLPYELRVVYKNKTPDILNKNMVIRQRDNNIYLSSRVEIKKNTSFEVYFEVSNPRKGNWLIYKNE